jgi:hypothetical protein
MSTVEGRDIVKQMLKDDFEYCGGQPWWEGNPNSEGQKPHHNYYQLKKQGKALPSIPNRKPTCVCGAEIWWQCYIMRPGDGPQDEMIIIGNECIKMFCDNKRTCSICKEPHTNRCWDLCNIHKEPVIKAEKGVIKIAKKIKKRIKTLMPIIDNIINNMRINMLTKLRCDMRRYTQDWWWENTIDQGIEYYLAEPLYLNVPYEKRQIAKTQYGCRWCKLLKKWYVFEAGIDAIVNEQLGWCFNSFKHIHGLRLAYIVE